MKENIMNRFKSAGCRPGQCIPIRLVEYTRLNAVEKQEFNRAVAELQAEGLLRKEDAHIGEMDAFLFLEKEGYDYIYPLDDGDYIANIRKYVLSKFKKAGCKVGHPIMLDRLLVDKDTRLNPKEQDLFKEALQSLIFGNFISVPEPMESPSFLILQERGYDEIMGN